MKFSEAIAVGCSAFLSSGTILVGAVALTSFTATLSAQAQSFSPTGFTRERTAITSQIRTLRNILRSRMKTLQGSIDTLTEKVTLVTPTNGACNGTNDVLYWQDGWQCKTIVIANAPPAYVPPVTTAAAPAAVCTASAEVCSAYNSTLARIPDKGGASFWEGKAQTYRAQGFSSQQVAAKLASEIRQSNEYKAKQGQAVSAATAVAQVRSYNAYNAANNISNASSACSGGTSCSGSSVDQAIEAAYASALGRSSDAAGAAHWKAQIKSGKISVSDLKTLFKNSAEGRARR